MKNKSSIFLFLFLFLFSCNNNKGIDKVLTKEQNDSLLSKSLIKKPLFPNIEKYQNDIALLYSDTNSSSWWSLSSVTTLDIGSKKMNIGWDFRCEFRFKSRLVGKKIILYWFYDPFNCCDSDITFFKKIKAKGPSKNMPFAEFYLINDTVGYMNYYYKRWVNEINSQPKEPDSLFPNIFIRKF